MANHLNITIKTEIWIFKDRIAGCFPARHYFVPIFSNVYLTKNKSKFEWCSLWGLFLLTIKKLISSKYTWVSTGVSCFQLTESTLCLYFTFLFLCFNRYRRWETFRQIQRKLLVFFPLQRKTNVVSVDQYAVTKIALLNEEHHKRCFMQITSWLGIIWNFLLVSKFETVLAPYLVLVF